MHCWEVVCDNIPSNLMSTLQTQSAVLASSVRRVRQESMESKINLAQVAPVNYKVTAALVNQFVVSTTQFLNRFVTRCDRKLYQVSAKMCRIQVRFHHLSLTNATSAHSPPRDA